MAAACVLWAPNADVRPHPPGAPASPEQVSIAWQVYRSQYSHS